MIKKKNEIFFYSIIIAGLLFGAVNVAQAADLKQRMAGRILLQVESHGEAWYVNPATGWRYYLGRPADAFKAMREQGIGITNRDLNSIPVGLALLLGIDSDRDGLPDELEKALGTNPEQADSDRDGFNDCLEIEKGHDPRSANKTAWDNNFATAQSGRIFLAVESRGEAWYVNPVDQRRYFLGRPEDAFTLMRSFGLGIIDRDLAMITAMSPALSLDSLERSTHELINIERQNQGQSALQWNNALAAVAREHSLNLARENEALTALDRSCNYAFIHHEGFDFGAYNQDRLINRGVYYYSQTGENIALEPIATTYVFYSSADEGERLTVACQAEQRSLDTDFRRALAAETDEAKKVILARKELAVRQSRLQQAEELKIDSVKWRTEREIAQAAAQGWMDSPGHRGNILTAAYDETGVGAAYVNGHIIITQVFIERAECGYETGACCEKDGYYPYCFTPFSCRQSVCQDV
ncbi:MAG: CAP domain-containing protein [Planctomycetes bacterium]|jgi:uncharacterized protein YkwD|nr:CAP domain-containing protein [Planctomycetota bacterium]